MRIPPRSRDRTSRLRRVALQGVRRCGRHLRGVQRPHPEGGRPRGTEEGARIRLQSTLDRVRPVGRVTACLGFRTKAWELPPLLGFCPTIASMKTNEIAITTR